jgi:hypothetical protein
MRKVFVCLVALGTFAVIAGPASARAIDLGYHSSGEIKRTCKKNGGNFNSYPDGTYTCGTKKGHVVCTKDGNCTGHCENCGGKAAAGGTTGKGSVGGTLTNATGGKAQPLRPQQVTTSPGRRPTQAATRSPKTAQPLTAQKTNGAAGTNATQSKTAPPSQGRNIH